MDRYITEEFSLYATYRDLSHIQSKPARNDYSTSDLKGLFLRQLP